MGWPIAKAGFSIMNIFCNTTRSSSSIDSVGRSKEEEDQKERVLKSGVLKRKDQENIFKRLIH